MNNNKNTNNKTRALATASLLAGICIVILLLGSVVTVLDLSCAAAASLVMILCVIELGGIYPWLVWAVVSVLSLLLIPEKFGPLVFFAFAGYYPMLKRYLERLPRLGEWILKLVVFNTLLSLIIAVSLHILGLSEDGLAFSIPVYSLCNIVFVVYDIALTRLISLYLFKLRKRLRLFK